MSDDNGKAKTGFGKLLSEHPTIVVLGLLGLWTTILIGGFHLWFQGAVESKNETISSYRRDLDECEGEREALIAERDSLRLAAKGDTIVLCLKETGTFFDERISVTLISIQAQSDTRRPFAQFEIKDEIAEQEWVFTADGERSCKFQFGTQECILYFLGFKVEEAKDCARIKVTKIKVSKQSGAEEG